MQHDYSIENQTGPSFRGDLNNALTALITCNSGVTAPATPYPNMFWVDTDASTHLLKQRNSNNTAWVEIGKINQPNWGLATLANPTFTGNPTAPTQDSGNDSQRLATTAFVQSVSVDLATLANPTFTGNPTAPTQTSDDASQCLATTAFVKNVSGEVVRTRDPAYDLAPGLNKADLHFILVDHPTSSFGPEFVAGIRARLSNEGGLEFLSDPSPTNPRLAILDKSEFSPGRPGTVRLGGSYLNWEEVYSVNGTINTSDVNEKQGIRAIGEAERRVAVKAKGLMRAFLWNSAVKEKGNDARIHFGIIAQDLEQAFASEGLDAGRYGMFIKGTWWEQVRVIPAVAAVSAIYDDEGILVSEAIKAQPEKTFTDTFDKVEDAPQGATERVRLGVRYSELLAFIIVAL